MRNKVIYSGIKKMMMMRLIFYIHLIIYLIVNLSLFLINLFFSPQAWWFFWPLIGWGIGLFSHFIAAILLNIPRIRNSLSWKKRRLTMFLKRKDDKWQ